MFRIALCVYFIFFLGINVDAQKKFAVLNETYNTGSIERQYLYELAFKDSFKVKLIDSIISFATIDSSVVLSTNFPIGNNSFLKTVNYYDKRKRIIKTEEYSNTQVQKVMIWSYDEQSGKKAEYVEENKVTGMARKETYEYLFDKINGDLIILIAANKNGKVEYYSKEYYDKSNRKYKEVRLNDNKKDILHTETYTYGENGKLKYRSVYFNEFNTTKDFKEQDDNTLAKCYKLFPLILTDRVTTTTKDMLIKKFLVKNQSTILDKDCKEFEYSYKSFNCDVVVRTNKKSNTKQLKIVLRDKAN